MKNIKCVHCEENLLEVGLNDPRASLYLSEYDSNTNQFKKMNVVFNPFYGWNCNSCDEELPIDITYDELEPYLIDLEELEDIDKNLLDLTKDYYVSRTCSSCERKSGKEYADIIDEGIEIKVDVTIKFNKEKNKFKIETIDDATFSHVKCACCGTELDCSFGKDTFTSSVLIPFL